MAILVMLYLSAAFDTVSPARMVQRLQQGGVCGTALRLLHSSLTNRVQISCCGGFSAEALSLACGGPQCSSLSLTLFSVYVDPLAELVHSFGFHILSYADDTQIIMSISNDLTSVAEKLHFCMSSISGWMKDNTLKLNADKTEVLVFASQESIWSNIWRPEHCRSLPTPVKTAKNLGVFFP